LKGVFPIKTIAIDIRNSVFKNETEAIMYATKDNEVEPAQYIFAIPVITFSWSAESEMELDKYFTFNVFGDKEKQKRLVNEMKVAIRMLEGS
jgi:hypothetical protein